MVVTVPCSEGGVADSGGGGGAEYRFVLDCTWPLPLPRLPRGFRILAPPRLRPLPLLCPPDVFEPDDVYGDGYWP